MVVVWRRNKANGTRHATVTWMKTKRMEASHIVASRASEAMVVILKGHGLGA